MARPKTKFRDPYGNIIPLPPKTQPVVIDQQGGGYILKELTEEEFERLGRHAFYSALREVNEQARVAEEKKKQNERTRIFSASIISAAAADNELQLEKEAQSKYWQFDVDDIVLDRGVL